MEIERKIAGEILKTIFRLKLPLCLDELTEGKGDCFPLALIAQCKRNEIWVELPQDLKRLILEGSPTKIRQAVRQFMIVPKDDMVKAFKKRYEQGRKHYLN